MSKTYSKKLILETIKDLKEGKASLLEFDPIGSLKGAIAGVKGIGQNIRGNYYVGAAKGAVDDFTKTTDKNWEKTKQNIEKKAAALKVSKNPDVQKTGEIIDNISKTSDEQVKKALATLRDKFPASISKMVSPEDQELKQEPEDNAVFHVWARGEYGPKWDAAGRSVQRDWARRWNRMPEEERERIKKQVFAKMNTQNSPEAPQSIAPATVSSKSLTPPPPPIKKTAPPPAPPTTPPASVNPKASKIKTKEKQMQSKSTVASPSLKRPPPAQLQQKKKTVSAELPPVKKEKPLKKLPLKAKKKIQDAAILPPSGGEEYDIEIPKDARIPRVPDLDRSEYEVDPYISQRSEKGTVAPPSRQKKQTTPAPYSAPTSPPPQDQEISMKDFMSIWSKDPEQIKMAKEKLGQKPKGRETVRPSKAPTSRPSAWPTVPPEDKFRKY